MKPTLKIDLFHPSEQVAVRKLILDGLIEHWGFLDDTKNPDLDNIQSFYQNATFLVAHLDNEIVGCGALVPHQDGVAEIVRMSIHTSHRRCGLGSQILKSLLEAARQQGFSKVILETTATWNDAIEFYLRNGFKVTHITDSDVYFVYMIDPLSGSLPK
jgi:N-acetylglutamate synthase-like GNAT family acetyltransferase